MGMFHTRLRQVMFYKGIRQVELAEKSGIDRSKISRYINGKNIPNAAALTKLAAALDVSPSWLMGEGEDLTASQISKMSMDRPIEQQDIREKAAPIIAEVITCEELDLIIRYRKADQRAREIVKLALDVGEKYPIHGE